MQTPGTGEFGESQLRAKQAIRGTVRSVRAARPAVAGIEDARGIVGVAGPRLHGLDTVALYVSLPREPGTGLLRAALATAGVRVLLPWVLPDNDLDWVADVGPFDGGDVRPVDRAAAMNPPGARLGVDAVAQAATVVLPALAVDTAGRRLGQGGGSYDRALARLDRLGSAALLVACVLDDEVRDAAVDPLPEEPHDRPVDAVLTPTRWLDLRTAPG